MFLEYIYMRFNFGHYLNTIMPKKRMSLTREEFLSRIYEPIIERYGVLDKYDQPYLIGRELTSNLFRCKSNLPVVLAKAFEKADKERDYFYSSFKSVFEDLCPEELFLEYTGVLVREIVSEKPFTKQLEEKFSLVLLKDDPYQIHWFLFKTLGAMENRVTSIPIRKQGRPKKNDSLKDFFYLSEEEKTKEFDRMVKQYSKEGSRISYEQFRYFLSSLAYSNASVSRKNKVKIIMNFFTIDFSLNNSSKCEVLTMFFENAKDALGRSEIYNDWIRIIPDVFVDFEIRRLKDLFTKSGDKGIRGLQKEFENNIDKCDFLKNEKFKQEFVNNNFFLPDFLGSIDEELWIYCHYISILASKASLQNEFTKHILSIKANSDQTRTVNDRCEALIERCQRSIDNPYY